MATATVVCIDAINRNQVHRDTGYSRVFVGRVFSGQRRPSLEAARKIAESLGISIDDLYDLLRPLWRGPDSGGEEAA